MQVRKQYDMPNLKAIVHYRGEPSGSSELSDVFSVSTEQLSLKQVHCIFKNYEMFNCSVGHNCAWALSEQ